MAAKAKSRTFDADERRKTRESATVKLGGDTLRPAPQTTELRARIRQLAAEQEALQLRAAKLGEAEQTPETIEQLAQLGGEVETVMYRIAAAMLLTKDGQHPEAEWIADELAPTDVGPLIDFLGDADEEGDADPS